MRRRHRMPFGAEVQPGGGVRFRLWAPAAHTVALCLEQRPVGGERAAGGNGTDEDWELSHVATSERTAPARSVSSPRGLDGATAGKL